MDYRKKRRGRKPANKLKAAAEELKAFPESDFEKFMANLKQEPVKTEEESERENLIFKINKLRLEIENLKEMKAIQNLRKTNTLLHIEVLQMRYKELMDEEAPPTTSKGRGRNASTTKDSINIKNVIYNNCSQTNEITPAKPKPETKSNYDPNFTYIASQLLSFFSDKLDANFASHMDSIKKYTHQIFQTELDNLNTEPAKKVSPIKIKCEKIEDVERSGESSKTYTIAKGKEEVRTARKKTTTVKPPPPPPSTVSERSSSPDVEAVEVTASKPPPKKKDLKFAFPDIKAKILEYLCGKVKNNVVVSAFRRLLKTKANAMLKQTFDSDHNRLLRVYLFDDGNILVQDMTICKTEFAKELYHSIRYYAIILSARTQDGPKPDGEMEIHNEPKEKVECIPERNLRSDAVSKLDLVVLEPLRDDVFMRPRFKVDMVQDTMVNEEFVLVSKNPFTIRPVDNEVVLSASQIELLKPLILKALSSNSQLGLPVISIVPNSVRSSILQDFGSKNEGELFLLKSPENSQQNYKLSEIRNVVEMLPGAASSPHYAGSDSGTASNKRKASESSSSSVKKKMFDGSMGTTFKPIKVQETTVDESISFVNVHDIINAKFDSNVKMEVKEECIDLSDDEDENTIVIN